MDFLKSSDVEVAAYILHESKVPMYYKDLIMEVLESARRIFRLWQRLFLRFTPR